MPSVVNCKGRRSKKEPVAGEYMVQGFVTGLGSVEARVEEEYKERRSRALDERSIACSAVEVEASRIRGQSLFDGLIS